MLKGDYYKKRSRDTIEYIEIVSNPVLKAEFEETKKQFRSSGIPTDSIYAYHGTSMENVRSIIVQNFNRQKIKRYAFGFGHYFSEYPDIAKGRLSQDSFKLFLQVNIAHRTKILFCLVYKTCNEINKIPHIM